jgi:hypothetical protein
MIHTIVAGVLQCLNFGFFKAWLQMAVQVSLRGASCCTSIWEVAWETLHHCSLAALIVQSAVDWGDTCICKAYWVHIHLQKIRLFFFCCTLVL